MNVQKLYIDKSALQIEREKTYIVFAANYHLANYVSSFLEFNGIPHKKTTGCYKNQKENSWIIREHDFNSIKPLLKNEQAVLELGPDCGDSLREASLVYLDTNLPKKQIGKFTQVDLAEAENSDYTSIFQLNSRSEIVPIYFTALHYDKFKQPIKG